MGNYTKKKGGTGAPRIGSYQPEPFIGTWEQARGNTIGMGTKKKQKGARPTSWSQFTIQKRSSIKYSLVRRKFHKNIPSNIHL